MSNFLSHLALKSLHPTETVQPRLAARFEPIRPAVEPSTDSLAIEASEPLPTLDPLFNPAGEQRDEMSVSRSLAGHPAHRRKDLNDSSSIVTDPLADPELTRAMPFSPLVLTTPPHVLKTPLKDRDVQPYQLHSDRTGLPPVFSESPPLGPYGVRGELDALARRLRRLERAVRQTTTKLETDLSTGAARPEAWQDDPAAQIDQLDLGFSSSPSVMASTKLTVTPQIRRRTSPPSIHPQPLAKPATPTIQVTIGQIEVRATPSPSPAKKPAPSTPIMSLDEYLRQRNGRQL